MFRFLFGKSGKKAPSYKRSRPAKKRFDASELPQQLGLLSGVPLQNAVRRLESSLTFDFTERIKYRVQSEYPQMSDDEFACKWFELKRFFLMNLILQRTPMFSSEIDDIWHEMLMFTREYQRFGEQFAGGVIHHSPEREPREMPGERAWFDWVYAHLFEFAPSSAACWNGFFRYPLDRERTDLLRSRSEEEIAALWFDTGKAEQDPEIADAIRFLVKQAVAEAERSADSRSFEDTGWSRSSAVSGSMLHVAAAMVFFSIADAANYSSGMNAVLPAEEESARRQSNCSASGCGGSTSCTSNSGSGSSGCSSSSCSSSGCSSGSSCGSGCGSS